jgi:hypothetical protein
MRKVSSAVLIVDHTQQWGADLRDRLAREHVKAYFVSSTGSALAFARSKPVAAAVVENDGGPRTDALCWELQKLGVEAIYRIAPSTSPDITAAIMRPKPKIFQ